MTEVVKFRLTGIVAMLQNNPRMIDQNCIYTKKKKQFKKADQGSDEYQRNDWEGAMYFDDKMGPYIPSDHIEASLANASSKLNNKYRKLFKASVLMVEQRLPIAYKGPRDLDKMWSEGMYDLRNVKIGGKGIIKCRPRFEAGWKTEGTLTFTPTKEINTNSITSALELAGQFHGLGDYLPKFGRFTVEII
jgi:hypothetical protein